jgi:hypothetical protein
MALTKAQALDKFCTFFKYDDVVDGEGNITPGAKLPGETKVQFLNRKQKEWALQVVERQVREEKLAQAELAKEAVFQADLSGLDL